jgi:ABC-type multidrug transport system fused ATPase/permease subunit
MVKNINLLIIEFGRFFNLLELYYKKNKKRVYHYIFAMVVDSFAKVISVIAIIPLVDFLSGSGIQDSEGVTILIRDILSFINIEYTLGSSISIFIIGALIGILSEILFYYILRKNEYSILFFFTSNGFLNYYDRGLKFINSQSFGIIQNTFGREVSNIADGVSSLLLIVSNIIQTILMLIVAFSLSEFMTSITLLIITAFFFIVSGLNPLIKKISLKAIESGNELSHALYEPLLNAKQVLAFGRVGMSHDNHALKYIRHANDAVHSQVLVYSIPLFFRFIGVSAALVALYLAILNGHSPVGLVAAFVTMVRMTPVISQLASSFSLLSSAIPSLNQFEKLFGEINATKKSSLSRFNGFINKIKLTGVSYSHDSNVKTISDINLTIKKNSYTAFVGASGSGKTTCIDIIIGLLEVSHGSVTIDGKSLNKIDKSSFLSRVGYVQQIPFLFSGTIRDNLLWSNPDSTELEMWEALHLASIDKYVSSLKHKLDTQVGDKGVSMSGGQRQRIALSQSLIRKPEILVLDEITSALDYESESAIANTIKNIANSITIILITHKPIMTMKADQIFVFENGRVIENGTYEELYRNNQSFLYKMTGEII